MKYWPLSTLRDSPLMPANLQWELAQFYQKMPSQMAFEACLNVARKTQPIETGILVIESVNAPLRTMYARYPDFAEWMALEQAGVFEADDGYLFMSREPVH